MEKFHQRIARLRENAGLTLQEIADAAGVSYQAVQKWEAGKSMPRGAEKQKIVSEMLRTTPAYLLYGDTNALSVRTATERPAGADLPDAVRGTRPHGKMGLITLCSSLARMLEEKTNELALLQERLRQLEIETPSTHKADPS